MIPIYCPLCCDQPFDDQDGLFHHLRSLRNNLFCPICSERFSSFDFLIKHLSRKCHGPASPREAKRKCLYSDNKLPDTSLPSPLASSSSLDPENTQDVLKDTSSAVTCNSVVANPAPAPVIPPDIRLPRSVTLCPLNTESPSQNNTAAAKPTTSPTNNSLSIVLNKDSLNPNPIVEINVKPDRDRERTLDKSIQSGLSVTNSLSTNNIANSTVSSCPSKRCRKAGPLSSKFKEKEPLIKSSEVQTEDQSLLKKHSNDILSNEVVGFYGEESLTKKVINAKTSNSKTNLSRESCLKDDNDKSPKVNGVNVEQSPIKTINNKRKTRKSPINTFTEEVRNRSIRTRGKHISYRKLLNSDDSDFDNDSSCDPDKKGDSEDLISNSKKNGDICKTKPTVINEKQTGKEVENTNTKPEILNLDSELSSCKGEPNRGQGDEKKDILSQKKSNPAKEEINDISALDESKAEEEEEEYTCSACNIRFTSIYEHIKQYHNGQEVVVEVPEEEIKEDLKAYQETSESMVSIGDPEPTDTAAIENSDNSVLTKEQDNEQSENKSGAKRKKETKDFSAEDRPNDLVYTKTFKKVQKYTGEHWVELRSDNKRLFQFVRDEDKFRRLMNELGNNTSIHPKFNMPIKTLFESPKINVVEITFQPNSPIFVNRTMNLSPMPMFIVNRSTTNNPDMLGGIASYIMAGEVECPVPEEAKLIAVMKVILASDQQVTVENLVFNDKPANSAMVPVLEDVKSPDIPLLKGAKVLKWRCIRCLATTWKFPVHKDTHYCNACPICHKTFISPLSLKKHLVLHRRDGTKYCKDCRTAFVSKIALNSHLALHMTHDLCDKCHLFVEREKIGEHTEVHSRDLSEQFPCSVCKKVYGSNQDLNNHETKVCSKLVARFNCSLCDKKFLSLAALSHHTAAHKNAAIKLNCRFCPKSFIQEREQCHKKTGKRKPSISNQKIWHERIHTRDRPYSCASCPRRFRSQEHELQHSATAHSHSSSTASRSVPVHMCTYCDRVFSSEKQLSNHMEQHTVGT